MRAGKHSVWDTGAEPPRLRSQWLLPPKWTRCRQSHPRTDSFNQHFVSARPRAYLLDENSPKAASRGAQSSGEGGVPKNTCAPSGLGTRCPQHSSGTVTFNSNLGNLLPPKAPTHVSAFGAPRSGDTRDTRGCFSPFQAPPPARKTTAATTSAGPHNAPEAAPRSSGASARSSSRRPGRVGSPYPQVGDKSVPA